MLLCVTIKENERKMCLISRTEVCVCVCVCVCVLSELMNNDTEQRKMDQSKAPLMFVGGC